MKILAIPLTIACTVVGGCAAPRMLVPPDIAPATDPMAVQGYSNSSGMLVNEDFKIGDFAVSHVSRGGKSTSKFGAFGGFKSDSSAGYSFDLVSGAQSLHGECSIEESESGFTLGALTTSKTMTRLGCACGNEGSPAASVVMSAGNSGDYGGSLKVADATFEVKAIRDREGGMSGGNPAGYRVDGQGVTAAVDVIAPGRVWLAKGLADPQRTNVTCILAGLMLYKPTMKH
jgi:hypothetical protein